jgi:hypothetical protein
MKCPRCKSRGEKNVPDYILRQQQGKNEVYMICPKCGYYGGSLKGERK